MTNTMTQYTKALIFVTKAHAGQVRRNGDNYIIHPIRVSQEVKTEEQKVIALLHDVIEDTDTEIEEIKEQFGLKVAQSVCLLTHYKGETYQKYISAMLPDPNAVAVKIADICDNLSDSPTNKAIVKSAEALTRLVA